MDLSQIAIVTLSPPLITTLGLFRLHTKGVMTDHKGEEMRGFT